MATVSTHSRHVHIASKTLAAIENTIKADQGASYRGWLGRVIMHIGDAYRDQNEGHRSHMGASLLGGECPRAIWYGFRWATKSKFGGRLLRLFNRGHLEEARFIAMLLTIGCEVFQQDEHGKQYRISFAEGHAGGSGDGVVIGLPDLPAGQPALAEFKTHNDKSFKKLQQVGVREAKWEHYVQMNLYMRKMGIPVALYMAVNKNDDDLYAEIISLDVETADQYLERGERLVVMQDPPERMHGASAGFYLCKWCNHRDVCHLQAKPDFNCRTCEHAQPIENAQWRCMVHDKILTKEDQFAGCESHQVPKDF